LKPKWNEISEQELIKFCKENNQLAQRYLFEKYAPALLGVCFRYAKNRFDAEEMMQIGFINFFKNIDKFKFDSSLSTWLTRIMINAALNFLKANEKIKWEQDLEVISQHDEYTTELFQQIDLNILMDCIQQLPTGYRIVLNMYAIEGYSHKEIAAELNINESTSRSQFTRAKAMLEKKIVSLGFNHNKYARQRI
jgi:RNA polymerase sigma-70 factor (ECF subfamily)